MFVFHGFHYITFVYYMYKYKYKFFDFISEKIDK